MQNTITLQLIQIDDMSYIMKISDFDKKQINRLDLIKQLQETIKMVANDDENLYKQDNDK